MHASDRQTDRQTDRILIARSRLHFMQRGKNEQQQEQERKSVHGDGNKNAFLQIYLTVNQRFITEVPMARINA